MAASPYKDLATIFRVCSIDPTEVQSNLDNLLKTFMESYTITTTDEKKLVRQKCCYESKTWYYKILEGLLQEYAVFNVSNFLEDKQLQSCLVVCCLEITLYTNKLSFGFDPQLLRIFCAAPYHFWHVLTLVLHTKADLALNVIEHLIAVKEMVVDSLVWARDSPLWEDIRANEGQMPNIQQVMVPKELEDPMRREQPDLTVDTTFDPQKSSLNGPHRKGWLQIFACKVYRLMHNRLRTLCSSLSLHEELCMKIWTCFEYALVHHFDMLRDCRLHWLLLCAAHDLTKDNKGLSFKNIINCYKINHIRPNVPTLRGCPEKSQSDNNHGVRLPTPTTPLADQEDEAIISFYCQVYTPVMAPLVKQFSLGPGTETPPLSPYPTTPPACPRKVRFRSGYNIFVSPLNKETPPPKQPIRTSYVFPSSPCQGLTTTVSSSRPCPKRALNFLDEDDKDEEAGPSAKIPHMSGQSSLLKRLEDVDRERKQSRAQDTAGPSSRFFRV